MPSPTDRAHIVINGGTRVVETEPGEPLLFALMAQGIFLPSACGGRGSCGQCRARITSATAAHNNEERGLIAEPDRIRGVHLACQVPVQGTMSIELPVHFLEARQYTSRVLGRTDFGSDLRELTLAVDEPDGLSFRAGQYVQFVLPGTERDRRPVYRAYSITSSPSRPRSLDLLFGRVERGACTGYVFEKLSVGDRVALNGPFGEFFLHEGDRPIVMVAGGTGIAPLRAMLRDMAEHGVRRPTTLFYGARTSHDLAYRDDLRDIQGRLHDFRFFLSITHPSPEDAWDGERGGLPSLLARHLTGLDEHEVYLCGSPGVVGASIAALKDKGARDERIFFDKF